jgi:hypothetical protein
MGFRTQDGPPASTKQVQQLRSLLEGAGYTDFRNARGPLGLTQRQGLGKFTHVEAQVLIEQLELESEESTSDASDPAIDDVTVRPLKDIPTDVLLAELRLRDRKDSKP